MICIIFAEKFEDMNVCFVAESIFSFGGVQRVTAVIAKELSKTAKVTIMTFDSPESKDTSLYALDETNIGYEFLAYPEVGTLKQKWCKAYSFLYRRLLPQTALTSALYAHSSFPSERRQVLINRLNAYDYDAIIAVHAPIATRLAAIRNSLKCKNLIGWIHNSFEAMFSEGSWYAGPELEKYFVYQFRRLTHAVVLCHCDVAPYQKRHAFTPEVIYNPLTLVPQVRAGGFPPPGQAGVRAGGFSPPGQAGVRAGGFPPPGQAGVRAGGFSPPDKFLAVGRFSHRHKGFDLLIEAFALFAKTNQHWTLDIVGEGTEEPLYRRLIAEHHLEERIHLHPFTNNIQAYYAEAQVYVLSSRWEGFGLVLVEAMAHGLPVVSSDLPTSKEIMGDFALYFPNGNVAALAQRLKEATQIDREEKAKEALQIAERFNIKTIIKQWQRLIQNNPA